MSTDPTATTAEPRHGTGECGPGCADCRRIVQLTGENQRLRALKTDLERVLVIAVKRLGGEMQIYPREVRALERATIVAYDEIDGTKVVRIYEPAVPSPSQDPVHHLPDGWYFWDETWSNRSGPFPTEAIARAALHQYAKELE